MTTLAPAYAGSVRPAILEWWRINFHVVRTFTDGVCEGIEYEGA